MTVTTEVDDERTDKKMMNVDVNPNVGIYTYTALNLALGITGTVSYVIYDSVSNMKAALNVSFGEWFNFFSTFMFILSCFSYTSCEKCDRFY